MPRANFEWITQYRRDISWTELDQLQQECVASVLAQPERGYLLVSEPRPTFTAGRSARAADLIWTAPALEQNGVEVRTVSRGGQWTYHGPGQIVLYPIAALTALGLRSRAVVPFLETLRQGVLAFLARHGVHAEAPANSKDRPFGIYVDNRKLVSFGISLQRGICANGLALYLSNQESFFSGIHPCGVPGAAVTSLQQLGVSLCWDDAARQIVEHVKKSFQGSGT